MRKLEGTFNPRNWPNKEKTSWKLTDRKRARNVACTPHPWLSPLRKYYIYPRYHIFRLRYGSYVQQAQWRILPARLIRIRRRYNLGLPIHNFY